MSIPCTQETTISHISKTLDRMERSQDRLIELMETVSNQEARLDNLENHTKKCVEHADILFERVRDLELNSATAPLFRESTVDSVAKVNVSINKLDDALEILTKKIDKLNRFFYFTTHKYALAIYGSILTIVAFGFFMDVLYHLDKIKALIALVRG